MKGSETKNGKEKEKKEKEKKEIGLKTTSFTESNASIVIPLKIPLNAIESKPKKKKKKQRQKKGTRFYDGKGRIKVIEVIKEGDKLIQQSRPHLAKGLKFSKRLSVKLFNKLKKRKGRLKMLNVKGQGNITSLIMVPITVIMLVVVFQLLDAFNNEAFTALDCAENDSILYIAMIKLLLGVLGILLVLLVVNNVIKDFQKPPPPQQY